MSWNERTVYELLRAVTVGQAWLDLGCGRALRGRELANVRAKMHESFYVGVDCDRDSLRGRTDRVVDADAAHLPFADESFGVVSSDMVFEHLDNPAAVLRECLRVLTDDGILLIHTACCMHYLLLGGRVLKRMVSAAMYRRTVSNFTGRDEIDIFPTHYRVNTHKKLQRALESSGFNTGFVAELETPDRKLRLGKYMPRPMRSSLLAIYFKTPSAPVLHQLAAELDNSLASAA